MGFAEFVLALRDDSRVTRYECRFSALTRKTEHPGYVNRFCRYDVSVTGTRSYHCSGSELVENLANIFDATLSVIERWPGPKGASK